MESRWASPNSAFRGFASRRSAAGARAGKGRKVMAGRLMLTKAHGNKARQPYALPGGYMQVILLSRSQGAARSFSLDSRVLAAGLATLAVVVLASGIALGGELQPFFNNQAAQVVARFQPQRATVNEWPRDALRSERI